MQTFLPYPDFDKTASVLDYKRLGKQRVETLQIVLGILRINPDGTPKTSKRTWGDHVVGIMWSSSLDSLLDYQTSIIKEWVGRGYRDTCLDKTKLAIQRAAKPEHFQGTPVWIGNRDFHRSHQSNLTRKFPEHYGHLWPDVPDDLPYVWPIETTIEPLTIKPKRLTIGRTISRKA